MLNRPEKAFETAMRRAHAGDQRAALRILDELLENNPYHLEARAHRALLRYLHGLYEGAAADAGVVLQVHPNDDDALALSGDCMLQLGRAAEASRFYLDAIQRNPGNRRAIGGLAMLAEGDAHDRAPEFAGRLPGNLASVIARLSASVTRPGEPLPPLLAGVLAYTIVRAARPDAVIEFGAMHGFLSLCVAQALEHGSHGHLHSVGRYTADFFGGDSEAESQNMAAVRHAAHRAGLDHRMTLHPRTDSATVMGDFVAGSTMRRMVLAHTDTQGGGAWSEFVTLVEMSRPGVSFLLVEDTANRATDAVSPVQRLRTGRYGGHVALVSLAELDTCRLWTGERLECADPPPAPSRGDSPLWRRILPGIADRSS